MFISIREVLYIHLICWFCGSVGLLLRVFGVLRLRWDVIVTFLTVSVSTARALNSEIRQKPSHKIIRAYIALAFWIPTFGACQWFRKNGDKSCSLCTKFLRILLRCYLDSWGDKGNKSKRCFAVFVTISPAFASLNTKQKMCSSSCHGSSTTLHD